MRSSMSIYGMYSYDPTIFDNFHFPLEQEPAHYGKEMYVERILLDALDLELVYPDPVFMKRAIQIWSLSMVNNWDHIAHALLKAYNPIENYNRTETWTDTDNRTENWTDTDNRTETWNHGGTTDDTGTVDVKRTDNLKQKTGANNKTGGVVEVTDGGTETNSAIAYPSDNWKHNTKTETDKTIVTTTDNSDIIDQTVDNTGTQDTKTTNNLHHSVTENGGSTIGGTLGRTGSVGGSVTHTGNISGNIGVTTSQQMVQAEIDLRIQNNLIDIVVRDFIQKFCILVY